MQRLPKYTQVSSQNTQKTKLQKSRKQESRAARLFDGKLVARSGAGLFSKGDVNLREAKIEAKRTDNDSMSIKLSWLKKIAAQAFGEKKFPVLAIEFHGSHYYVLEEAQFQDYLAYLRQ